MTDNAINPTDSGFDALAEKKRLALLKEFGLSSDLQEAPDRAPLIRTGVVLGCLALFVAALFFPAVTYIRPGNLVSTFPTWALLAGGWAFVPSIFDGNLWAVGWLANVALLGVVIELSVQQERGATIAGAFAVVFAAMSFTLDTIPLNNNGPPFPVASFEPGLYLWQGAMVLGLAGSALLWWLDSSLAEPGMEPASPWQ